MPTNIMEISIEALIALQVELEQIIAEKDFKFEKIPCNIIFKISIDLAIFRIAILGTYNLFIGVNKSRQDCIKKCNFSPPYSRKGSNNLIRSKYKTS
jgi:hypothetical protein